MLKGLSARERALEVFSLLRIWDTEENAGVLVYLLMAMILLWKPEGLFRQG